MLSPIPPLYLIDSSPLDAERILIDRNNFAVLQNRLKLGPDRAQINGHHQRCSHNRPKRHLCFGLFVAESEVADDQL